MQRFVPGCKRNFDLPLTYPFCLKSMLTWTSASEKSWHTCKVVNDHRCTSPYSRIFNEKVLITVFNLVEGQPGTRSDVQNISQVSKILRNLCICLGHSENPGTPAVKISCLLSKLTGVHQWHHFFTCPVVW